MWQDLVPLEYSVYTTQEFMWKTHILGKNHSRQDEKRKIYYVKQYYIILVFFLALKTLTTPN